jgi:hypothetical protein
MKTKNIIEGLLTLQPYYDDSDGYNIGTEYDVLYAYKTDRPLSADDVENMVALGWYQNYDGLNEDGDFSSADYRPGESWVAYT